MTEPLTTAERDLLAKTISEALSGRINLGFAEIPKLLSAAKKIGTSREHVVKGLGDWIRTDPQAQEIILQAAAAVGSKIFTPPTPKDTTPDVG